MVLYLGVEKSKIRKFISSVFVIFVKIFVKIYVFELCGRLCKIMRCEDEFWD